MPSSRRWRLRTGFASPAEPPAPSLARSRLLWAMPITRFREGAKDVTIDQPRVPISSTPVAGSPPGASGQLPPSAPPDAVVAGLAAYLIAQRLATESTAPVTASALLTLVTEPGFTPAQVAAVDAYLSSPAAAATISDAAAIGSVTFAILTKTAVPAVEVSASLTLTQVLAAAATVYVGLTKQTVIPPALWTVLASALLQSAPPDARSPVLRSGPDLPADGQMLEPGNA